MRSRTLSVSVHADPIHVYEFVIDPQNLPRWAPGFAHAVQRTPSGWMVDTGDSSVGIRFEPENRLGVADHWVTVEPDVVVYNALRIVPNGDGTEVVFTFFQTPDLTEAALVAAADLVAADLQTLRSVLENPTTEAR